MALNRTVKTTFEPSHTIQPFYTGGSVALSSDGRVFAATLGADATLTDLTTGKELCRIEGDGESLTSLSLTPDASHLITCSRSLSMRIYTMTVFDRYEKVEASLLRTLRPHAAPVVVSTVDATGTLLATGGADGIVKVWDIRGGFVTHTFHGHSGVISALHFFQVDNAQAGEGAGAKKRSRSHGRSAGEHVFPDTSEPSSTFRLASGGEDCKIRVWNLHNKKSAATLESHLSVIRDIDYSPEEHALVAASRDTTITLWDARTWKKRSTLAVSESTESCGFLERGKLIYTGGERGCLRVWSTHSGVEVTQEQPAKSEIDTILSILHVPQLPYVVSIQADQTILLHSLVSLRDFTGQPTIPPLHIQQRINGTHDEIIDMAFVGREKRHLALATNTEEVRIISLSGSSHERPDPEPGGFFGAHVTSLQGHDDIIICMDTDWSGNWLATGAKDNTARLWKIDPETDQFECYATLTGHAESLGAIALPRSKPEPGSAAYQSPLNHPPAYLVTGSQDLTVKRWSIGAAKGFGSGKISSRAVYTRKAHDKDINAIDTNDRGTLFASASQDRTVKIWSLEEGEVQGVLRGHKRGVWAVQFAPHGSSSMIHGTGKMSSGKGLVLTGSGDKTVRVWSLSDYSCLLTLEGHSNSVLTVTWLPAPSGVTEDHSDLQVASAGGDGLIKVWNLSTGESECTLDNHTDRVWTITARPLSDSTTSEMTGADVSESTQHLKNSRMLVSGGGDGVLTFWSDTTRATHDLKQQKESERVEQEQELSNLVFAKRYHEAVVLALQLEHPGRLLSIFQSVSETTVRAEDANSAICGRKEVDDVIAGLADAQIYQLLLRIRDWNTNARTADIAQRIFHVLVRRLPAERLANIKTPGAGKIGSGRSKVAARDLYSGIRAYTDRHLKRIEDLVEQSYLIDFTLQQMDEVAGTLVSGDNSANEIAVNGTNGTNGHRDDEDMIMVG